MQRFRIALVLGALLLTAASAVSACVGDDPAVVVSTPDAGADDAATGDATVDAVATTDAGDTGARDGAKPRCDVARPFAAPRTVVGLRSELAIGDSSFTGHVSGDGCTMVFFAGTGTSNALEIQIADKPPLP